jgi:hypothetical protein
VRAPVRGRAYDAGVYPVRARMRRSGRGWKPASGVGVAESVVAEAEREGLPVVVVDGSAATGRTKMGSKLDREREADRTGRRGNG